VSVHRSKARDGSLRYTVRWHEGGRQPARTFPTLKEARAWDAEVARRKRLGSLGMLDESRKTLRELYAEWWPIASQDLSPKSRRSPSGAWKTHVEPRLGGRRLNELSPLAIERFAADLRADGVGDGAVSKCWDLLRQMLGRAAAWGYLPNNPVLLAKRPKRRSAPKRVVPPSIAQIEAIRRGLEIEGATLVGVLAYTGLRPGECLALTWADVGEARIEVTKALSLGEVMDRTKTGRDRFVPLPRHVAADLRAWRLASGVPGDGDLVFPGREGAPWGENEYRRFLRGRYRKAANAAGIPGNPRLYALRHAFCSMQIAAGRSILEVAKAAGHSPTMTLRTYGHVVDEWEGKGPIDIEGEIRKARRMAA
jgi:integrase